MPTARKSPTTTAKEETMSVDTSTPPLPPGELDVSLFEQVPDARGRKLSEAGEMVRDFVARPRLMVVPVQPEGKNEEATKKLYSNYRQNLGSAANKLNPPMKVEMRYVPDPAPKPELAPVAGRYVWRLLPKTNGDTDAE